MRKHVVLVVEDDPPTRMMMARILKELADVVEVGDGETAATMLETQSFDLVCLDLVLPGLSGYQVCQYIQTQPHLQHTQIMVVTGRVSVDDQAQAFEAGAHSFLAKPFKSRMLLDKARAALALADQANKILKHDGRV